MARNVALSEKAYKELLKIKKSGESFSDIVIRLMNKEKKPSWRKSVGMLKNDTEAEKIFKEILESRHKRPSRGARFKW